MFGHRRAPGRARGAAPPGAGYVPAIQDHSSMGGRAEHGHGAVRVLGWPAQKAGHDCKQRVMELPELYATESLQGYRYDLSALSQAVRTCAPITPAAASA